MILSYWTLAVALSLSLIAAWYSIAGLAAIFAAAVVPIIIMGGIMEIAKITVTVWLHEYWQYCKRSMKIQLTASVVLLMFITSMGIFGFLSKAHTDQGLVSGDIGAKIAIYDEKIKIARDNIDANRRALTQLDAAVDQTMSRTNDERGAERAVQIRRSQQTERTRLLREIEIEQKKIQALNEEAAPIRAEVRKVEAEVGPIKYIAALIYGDNPDANLLERAVRWMIVILVLVFDPLAIMMVLAATESIKWERQMRSGLGRPETDPDTDDQPIKDWFDHARERARFWDKQPKHQSEVESENKTEPIRFAGFPWPMSSVVEKSKDIDQEPKYEADNGPLTDEQIEQIKEAVKDELPTGNVVIQESLFEAPEIKSSNAVNLDATDERPGDYLDGKEEKEAMRRWKESNPEDTIKHQRDLFEHGKIDHLPWMGLIPDNEPQAGQMLGFGTVFPPGAKKGDTFLRVDQMPSVLYKYNGKTWIVVDKSLSDQYAYDTAYIDHLIEKIESGEYDPELLSAAEQDQIEHRLKNK
ncbi:hypothetical protein UFOVP328_371 [uncultured Caudovirales phage]|uniref:DUF4407 domain-containing protein n=1 Tax=uncultured Caudovirales phage TaxID=2100421 RepID=A0A6J5LUR6_9CAUD|nr:hypothetical protein UFOVP328_371 [uncultured Caudovirales phage]